MSLALTYSDYFRAHFSKKPALSEARALKLKETLLSIPDSNSVLIIDGDNLRGKTSFSVTKEELLDDLGKFQKCIQNTHGKICVYYDHGTSQEAYKLRNHLNVIFSGDRTADDSIVRDISWYQKYHDTHVTIVTADSGLRARCSRVFKSKKDKLNIIDSNLFVEFMDHLMRNASSSTTGFNSNCNNNNDDIGSTTATVSIDTPTSTVTTAFTITNTMDASDKENALTDLTRLELRLRDQIRSMTRMSTLRSGGRKKRMQFRNRLSELESRLALCIQKSESLMKGKVNEQSSSRVFGVDLSNESKERRMSHLGEKALSDLLHKGSGRGREETWERCIHAERLRRKILRDQLLEKKDSPLSSPHGHVNYLLYHDAETMGRYSVPVDEYIRQANKNFSCTDFKALLAASLEDREVIMKSLDEQSAIIDASRADEIDITSRHAPQATLGGGSLKASSPMPLRSLGSKTSQEHRALRELIIPEAFIFNITTQGVRYTTDSTGCRLFNVSLSNRNLDADKTRIEKPIARLVCVSDTHGFERVLDGLVPYGDVLIHAGDYAPNAKVSRSGKHSKKRSKNLDAWLATQPHPIKIVVRGNHDPLNPEFPKSNAFHFNNYCELHLQRLEHSSQEGNNEMEDSEVEDAFSLKMGRFPSPRFRIVDQDRRWRTPPGIQTSSTVPTTGATAGMELLMRDRIAANMNKHQTKETVILGILPYGCKHVPVVCDVCISHEPVRGILDETLKKGKHAGSEDLLHSANEMWGSAFTKTCQREIYYSREEDLVDKVEEVPNIDYTLPPAVWICGHIHEGYSAMRQSWPRFNTHLDPPEAQEGEQVGAVEDRQGDGDTSAVTTFFNVANANPGPAHSLVTLPTVIDLFE